MVGVNKASRYAVVDVIVGPGHDVTRHNVDGVHHGKHPLLDAVYRLPPFVVVRSRGTAIIAHHQGGSQRQWGDTLPPLQPCAQDPVGLVLVRPQDRREPGIDEALVDGPGPKEGNRTDRVDVRCRRPPPRLSPAQYCKDDDPLLTLPHSPQMCGLRSPRGERRQSLMRQRASVHGLPNALLSKMIVNDSRLIATSTSLAQSASKQLALSIQLRSSTLECADVLTGAVGLIIPIRCITDSTVAIAAAAAAR